RNRVVPPLRRFSFQDPPPTEIYTLSLHDALPISQPGGVRLRGEGDDPVDDRGRHRHHRPAHQRRACAADPRPGPRHAAPPSRSQDRKSTRLNSSHVKISYAVFCLKKKTNKSTHK